MFKSTSLLSIGTRVECNAALSLLTVLSLSLFLSLSNLAFAEASSFSSSNIEQISKIYTNEDLLSLKSLKLETESPLYQVRGESEEGTKSEHAASGSAHHDDGHGEDSHDGHHKPGVGSLFWSALNFTLYIFVLVWAYKKVGKAKLAENAASIRSELSKASALLKEAEKTHGQLKADLDAVEEKKLELKDKLLAEGKKIAVATVEKAKNSATNAEKDTERRVQSEFAKASANISSMLASRATGLAREQLGGSVNADDDARLRAEALELL